MIMHLVKPTIGRDGVDIVEAPNTEELKARLLDAIERRVDIRITRGKTKPVGVCTGVVFGHAVNIELQAIDVGKR